ncbi:MAG: histidine kinase [Acidobacteriota bacterium]
MPRDSLQHGRRLLLAGFGGLLLLMLAGGLDSLIRLSEINRTEAQVRETYLQRAQSLEQIRSGIYQSSILLRDFLLASDPDSARDQAQKWDAIRAQTDRTVALGAASVEPEEVPLFQNLQKEVQDYWNLRQIVVLNTESKRSNPYSSGDLVRRRTALLALIDRIDQINHIALTSANTKVNAAFEALRWRTMLLLFITMGVGIGLAAFTARRTLLMEAELQQRYEEGARARQELQELSARLVSAQEEERRSIARELHDEVGQSLSALLMEAGNAAARVPPDSTEVRRHVESIKRLAEASVQVIRNMSLLLRPSMLDDLGLVPALEWQAREVSKRTGLRVQVNADENASELPDEHKTCIYRVVQEALHNCARHAQAHNVLVDVQQQPTQIVLSVEDDGRGFDAHRVRGLGLVGMQERVHHLGGELRVHSKPGSGTTIAVMLPLAS